MATTIKAACPQLFILCWIVLGIVTVISTIAFTELKSENHHVTQFVAISLTVWVCAGILVNLMIVVCCSDRPVEVDIMPETDGGEGTQMSNLACDPAAVEQFI